MDDFLKRSLLFRMRLALWLLRRADSQSMTHAEKHYFHKVIEDLLMRAIFEDLNPSGLLDNGGDTLDANDIPF